MCGRVKTSCNKSKTETKRSPFLLYFKLIDLLFPVGKSYQTSFVDNVLSYSTLNDFPPFQLMFCQFVVVVVVVVVDNEFLDVCCLPPKKQRILKLVQLLSVFSLSFSFRLICLEEKNVN